jgi:hypothetical protein
MKKVKQIRESYDLITEKEEAEDRKLSTLVRAGLYDAKKLPALKKALEKSADKMTGQEKRMLLNLLDSLIDQVVGNDQVFRKVKQNVQHISEAKEDYLSKFDPRFKGAYPTDKDIPSVVILKRKAIRVYPDNQKVALYYSQALDKYVTIPFSDIQTGINEEVKKDDDKKKSPFKLKPQTGSAFKQEKAKRKAKKEKEDEFSSIGARSRALADRGVNVGGRAGTIINDLIRGKIKKAEEKPKETAAPESSKPESEKTAPVAASVPKATRPARPAKATRPARPAKATRPARPARPAKATRPARPAKATRPARPAKATRPARPAKATRPARPAKSYAPANMDLPGLSESFKHKLQMMREDALDMLDARYGPMYSGSLWDTQGRGLGGGGAGRRAGVDVLKRIQKQPTIDKPANQNIINKSKADVLKAVKKKVDQKRPAADAKAAPTPKAVQQTDLKPPPASLPPSSSGTFNKDIPSKDKTVSDMSSFLKKRELEKNIKSDIERTTRYKTKLAAQKQAKTGFGTSTGSVSNPPASSVADKPAQSPGLKTGPSFEKTGRGTAPSIPNKPKKPAVSPNREAEPYTPAPAAVPATAPVPNRSVQQQPKPQTAPRDAAQPYKSNAEKAAEKAKNEKSEANREKARSNPPKARLLPLALAAAAGGAMGGAVTHAFKLKPSTGNAWDKQQRDISPALRQRLNQANMRMMQQNESVVDTLKHMLDNDISEQTLSINEQEININNTAAKKIMYVYESVNATNKKKMEKMLNESAESFTKVLTFAIRQ